MCIERTEEKERGREREETHLISGGTEDIVASGVEADASHSSLVCLQINNRDAERQRLSELGQEGLADSLE